MGKRGFTLAEIMIVVAIIAIISAIALPNFITAKKGAQTGTCKANLRQLDSAIMRYAADNGANPADLNALVPDYVRTLPKCPLGNDYDYDNSTGIATCPNASQGHSI